MSVWDDRNLEIAAQRRADAMPTVLLDGKGQEIPARSNGFGYLMMPVAILAGIGFASVTYGLSIVLAIIVIAVAGTGEKVADKTAQAMHQNATQRNPDGVDEAYRLGCIELLFIAGIAAVAMGGVLVMLMEKMGR
jgi:hypothetical protein